MFAEILEKKLFDQLLNESTRVDATNDLIRIGRKAIPLLKLLFEGEAKNSFGVPYRELGTPLSCALIAAAGLGVEAKPLEKYIAAELANEHPYAAPALAAIKELNEESISVLCRALRGSPLVAVEAVVALKKCNALNHPLVSEVVRSSKAIENMVLKYGVNA